MGQVNRKLRRVENGFAHWCPGCQEIHILPDRWHFSGNLDNPSFRPSFKHEGLRRVFANGSWTGEWVRDANGNTIPYLCHYIVTDGNLQFQGDCTHALSGKTVPMPDLPEGLIDTE